MEINYENSAQWIVDTCDLNEYIDWTDYNDIEYKEVKS